MVVKDIGAYLKVVAANALGTGATAAATKTGVVLDRLSTATFGGTHYQSCKIGVVSNYSKTSVGAWTITPTLQHSDSTVSTAFVGLSTGTAIALVATDTSGTNLITQTASDVDLTMGKRYLRLQVTLGARTSVAGNSYNTMGFIVFGGADVLPPA